MGMNESWNNFWDDFGKNKTHAWLDSDPEDRKEGTALLSTVKRAATFGKKSSAELVIRTPMKTGDGVDNDWCFSSRYVIVVRLGSESWVHRLDGRLSLSLSFSSFRLDLRSKSLWSRVLPTIPFHRRRKIRGLVLAAGLFDYTGCKMNGVTD